MNEARYLVFFRVVVAVGAFLLVFASCTERGFESRGKMSAGTGDGGGGGNTCQGRALDFYKFDVVNSEAFLRHIRPVFDHLDTIESGLFLRLLKLSLDENLKTWYLLPCPLESLSPDKIGAPVASDQSARQTMDEIWISSTSISDDSDSLKLAELIVHEMMMAVELLKFESPLRQCSILLNNPLVCMAKNLSDQRTGKASQLTQQAYSEIRKASTGFFQLKEEKTEVFHIENFIAKHFYILSPEMYERLGFPTELSPGDVLKGWQLTSSEWTGNNPGSVADESGPDVRKNCQLNMVAGAGGFQAKLKFQGHEALTLTISEEVPSEIIPFYDMDSGELAVSFVASQSGEASDGTNEAFDWVFILDLSTLELISVSAYRYVCQEAEAGSPTCKRAEPAQNYFEYKCQGDLPKSHG